MVTRAELNELYPRAPAAHLDAFATGGDELLDRFGIAERPERLYMFLAQIGHEFGRAHHHRGEPQLPCRAPDRRLAAALHRRGVRPAVRAQSRGARRPRLLRPDGQRARDPRATAGDIADAATSKSPAAMAIEASATSRGWTWSASPILPPRRSMRCWSPARSGNGRTSIRYVPRTGSRRSRGASMVGSPACATGAPGSTRCTARWTPRRR